MKETRVISLSHLNSGDAAAAQPATTAARWEVVASIQTDVGCVREANEDSGRHVKPNDPALFATKGTLTIVCDGMGGHASGEVASQMTVDLVSRLYYQDARGSTESLRHAVEEANRRVYAASVEDERLHGMGTTCTALALHNGTAFAAHVGDSRLYMVRGGEIYLMTEDHSAVMEMVKMGIISMEDARHHPDKNVILRALGTAPEVEVSTWESPLAVEQGDQYILCSDGLYDLVEDAEIRQAALSAADPHAACEQLIALAKSRGGHDNITVGIISVRPAGGDGDDAQKELRITRELEAVR
ncbi:MAG: Stp1/IreP family PP2C-type Ser/Thr phosphatase [Pyrinomonadaceae bacterium]